MKITEQQKREFLEHVRDGLSRPEAARKVGETGTRFRSLCRNDPLFDADYQAARDTGVEAKCDSLRDVFWERALAGNSNGSDRLLLVLAEAYLPELEHRRRYRVEHTGADGGPMRIDTGKLTDEQLETLLEMLRAAAPE